ncbi:hypothetical protein ACSVHR_11955 [Acinetobacter nosocomialis]|uniref:hypothetical protein n=1 Tax=Acinetobacter nosocomialis TaxID=106654 RepID=UPI003F6008FD
MSCTEKLYEEIEVAKAEGKASGREPHLRKSHWHLYWYGKKGRYERYDFLLIPVTIVGGVSKD